METRGGAVVPSSTYRLQLHGGFPFPAAAAVAPYLAELGVSHVYLSPILQAAAGSTHGYDVVDHHHVNDELGGADGYDDFCQELGKAGLGQLLDIVPNHMDISGPSNRWWWDVLENGPSSVFAAAFDVDWDPPEAKLRNTVLMPILGDHYGRELEAGHITVGRHGAVFTVAYYDHVLPAAPRTLDGILADAARRVPGGSEELESIGAAFGRLPKSTTTDREAVRQRHRDKTVLRAMLDRLCVDRPDVAAAVDEAVAALNADHDQLDVFLDRQNYRLSYWRTAGKEVDYRRFFDITTLVGVRMEDENVFAETHELVLQWVADGVVDGLRIDHVDGLRDPAGYLRRLAAATGGRRVVVEKILALDERLPEDWEVTGTTGYDFLARAIGVFVDPAGEEPLTKAWSEFTETVESWDEIVRDAKLLVMSTSLAADITRLTGQLVSVCERHRRYRDYTRDDLRDAIVEVVAGFDVYRTYVTEDGGARPEDCSRIAGAIDRARAARPDLDDELLGFVGRLLMGEVRGDVEDEFVARFQQVTSPVTAKAVEDTAGYRFTRLLALNDVGCEPDRFGIPPAEFHAAAREADERWPHTMLATSTHDTKRSEDVRARLALLSEIPHEWEAAVRRWSAMAAAPVDPAAQWLFFQTWAGAWPLSPDRALAYMEKALREAKLRTSWVDADEQYEADVREFVTTCMASGPIAEDVAAFVAPLVQPGRITSLAQQALKLLTPGVPDLYQGTELWDLSLVDPDNRRPVDYELRRSLLGRVRSEGAAFVLSDEGWELGAPKLALTAAALEARRTPGLTGYEPLSTNGARAGNALAFARGSVAVVVPRLVLGLDAAGGWGDTTVDLPAGEWRDAVWGGPSVAGGTVPVADLVGPHAPAAVLVRDA